MKKNYKTFSFKKAVIMIVRIRYGQYKITGLGTSVYSSCSFIWDWCDDDDFPEKSQEARRKAYLCLKAIDG